MSLPFDHIVTAAGLDDLYGETNKLAACKDIDHLDDACIDFIAHSPYVLMATSDMNGGADASPRGGPSGFVKVLDEHRLAIPDLNGNNRLDSIRNIVENPGIGLLFLIPSRGGTLRVNGKACLTIDPTILESFTKELRVPKAAIAVQVESAFLHCAKASLRAGLWKPETWHDGAASVGNMIKAHIDLDQYTAEELDNRLNDSNERDIALD